jgi:hypothetical protein
MRGGHPFSLLLFTLGAVAVFWLRAPLESWLGTSPLRAQTAAESRAVVAFVFAFSALAALLFTALFWDGRNRILLPLGAMAGLAFFAQAGLRKLSRKLRMPAQIAGAAGLTAAAPAAYCVMAGRFDALAAALWLANWLFAADQIHFVQLRLHAARAQGRAEKLRRGRAFLAGQVGLAAALPLAAAFRLLPWPALLAFVPIVIRGFAWFVRPARPLAVRRLGWSELAQSLAFGVLLIAALRL